MVLEWEGYQVACAADGREALDRLRGGERPSVILLDVAMPVLDGRKFRQEQGQDPALAPIPVVVISGVETAASVQAAAHVRKPFAPGQLLDALRHAQQPWPLFTQPPEDTGDCRTPET
jgi:CheY-like chemotaxis protein